MKNSDERLVRKAKSGDRNAFGKLVEKYHKKILYLAYDLVGNFTEAQDLAQEAFMKAFDKLSQFQERAQFSTWLYRITVNLAIDWHRKQARRQVIPLETKLQGQNEAKMVREPALEVQPTSEVEMAELRDTLAVALTQLSHHQRTATVLKYFHQKSSREIAEIMGCNENTVRIHIFRAMANLKKHLKGSD